MTATAWTAFCETLAALRVDDLQPEDVAQRLKARELRDWFDAQSVEPHQLIGDALEQLRDLDARLLVECLMADRDSTVPARILRDALRQCAITDAIYEAEKLRDRRDVEAALDAPASHWRVPAHFDGLAADRKALAAEHARMLREESTR